MQRERVVQETRDLEQRRCPRYQVSSQAYAMLCMHCDVLGRILNISRDGLAFRYLATKKRSDKADLLKVLLTDHSFSLDKLPYKTVWDRPAPRDFALETISYRHCGVQFGDLTEDQEKELTAFIRDHSIKRLTGPPVTPEKQKPENTRLSSL